MKPIDRPQHAKSTRANWPPIRTKVALTFCAAAISQLANAGTVSSWDAKDGGNGHFYELVETNTNWDEADAIAKSMEFDGLAGHLATITSDGERAFLSEHFFSSKTSYWLGGYQDKEAPDFIEPYSGWRWVTGEPFEFNSWSTPLNGGNDVEPNNSSGEDDYLDTEAGLQGILYWNDEIETAALGFLVEYESRALIPGDVTGDGKVDLSDFGVLKDHFGSAGTKAEGDANGDGQVDLSDFGLLKANFGTGGTAPVPEPASLLLAGSACVLLALTRLHSRRR